MVSNPTFYGPLIKNEPTDRRIELIEKGVWMRALVVVGSAMAEEGIDRIC
jgi:hypothetical protein